MISLDLHRMLNERGIENPTKFLLSSGFTRHTTTNLLHNRLSGMLYKHIEKLCLALQCTPNDLLSWQPDSKTTLYKNQPLNQLKRGPAPANIVTKLKALPADKLGQLRDFMDKLEKEE